ncbi:hypothetical protein CHH48_17020 [Terribacillus saccharophilus]|uniref:Riboflavin biosynthesis intermediates N-glycosidase n=1 Tax=Terribacillus saccharophilus TaxID=361277 RepID=A0ABX4GUF1_9BACI|nr:hypothetical protein CHH56_16615 [Terribacillus saccharophilus]PAD94739.1 hypothetical protein CHH50_16985 [Terribacillus saccharophilus]PAD98489.1 hypothetical protein CHH48_17020 [Terribacillus saccharophilus]
MGDRQKERGHNLVNTEQAQLQWPDLQFINWCSGQYGINRGIYNTIDAWLYEYGILELKERRKVMILFLQQAGQRDGDKFGKGGLARNLEQFITIFERVGT